MLTLELIKKTTWATETKKSKWGNGPPGSNIEPRESPPSAKESGECDPMKPGFSHGSFQPMDQEIPLWAHTTRARHTKLCGVLEDQLLSHEQRTKNFTHSVSGIPPKKVCNSSKVGGLHIPIVKRQNPGRWAALFWGPHFHSTTQDKTHWLEIPASHRQQDGACLRPDGGPRGRGRHYFCSLVDSTIAACERWRV